MKTQCDWPRFPSSLANKLCAAVTGFLLTTIPVLGQEVGLQQYLQRLRTAPGVTVEDKVRFLSNMGVTLSDQGMRDLIRGASASRTNPSWESWSTPKQPGSIWLGNEGSWTTPSTSTWSWDDAYRMPRSASSTTNRAGSFTYYNFDNGLSGTSSRIGNFTYYNFSNGLSGTSNDIGSFTYHNFNNGLNGSSNRIGSFTYHNFNNGLAGTSNRIGNFTYHNYNDGTSCITSRIGTTTYTNCNK